LEQVIDMRVAQQVGLLVDVAKHAKVGTTQVASSLGVNPSIMLTAVEFGIQLGGLSDETVRRHEKAGLALSHAQRLDSMSHCVADFRADLTA
jgi:hypothetical protein